MKPRWALLGVVLAGACLAVLYWDADEASKPAPPSANSASRSQASAPPPATLNAPLEAPRVANSSAPVPPSDGGAATLAQRLESNRLLKEAREADGSRQFDLYEAALKANPGNVDALMELGELRLEDEDWKDAEALARRCLALDPDRSRCQQTLERRFTRTGDFKSAADLYEGCLEEAFVKIGCLSFNVGAALRAKDIPRAKELHARLAALAPDSIDTLVLEAAIAREAGDDAAARGAYERGCKLGNEFACTWLAQHPE